MYNIVQVIIQIAFRVNDIHGMWIPKEKFFVLQALNGIVLPLT